MRCDDRLHRNAVTKDIARNTSCCCVQGGCGGADTAAASMATRTESTQVQGGMDPAQETGVRRRIAAVAAFENNDTEESRRVHLAPELGHNEVTTTRRESMVLKAAMDGIMFALMLEASCAKMEAVLLCLSLFVAARRTHDMHVYNMHYERERKREAWELSNYEDGEIEEMVTVYVERGMREADARRMMAIISSYPDVFLNMMMHDEIGMTAPYPIHWFDAAARVFFATFASGGVVQLVHHLAGSNASMAIAMLLLAVIGKRRAQITHMQEIRLILETLALGSAAALVSRAQLLA